MLLIGGSIIVVDGIWADPPDQLVIRIIPMAESLDAVVAAEAVGGPDRTGTGIDGNHSAAVEYEPVKALAVEDVVFG